MDYNEMTKDELKRLCRERGLLPNSKANKAEIVAMLEADDGPIDVEAVPVEDEIIPANALAIDAEALKDAAVELTAVLDDAATALGEFDVDDETLDSMPISEIRVCEEGIAAALRYVDEDRKELTRMLTAPKKAIDEKCKEITEPLKALAQRYADAREETYMKGYRAQYEECCIANDLEFLIDAVPFDGFMARHPEWTRRNSNPVKTQEKIADEVIRIARDMAKLRGLRGSMRFPDDAMAAFLETLDLQAAIDRNDQRTRQQENLDRMERERQEHERWMAEQRAKNAQEPVQTPVFTEVEPEPATVQEPPAEPVGTPQERKHYRFSVWLTDAELQSLREWKNALNIGADWKFGGVENG